MILAVVVCLQPRCSAASSVIAAPIRYAGRVPYMYMQALSFFPHIFLNMSVHGCGLVHTMPDLSSDIFSRGQAEQSESACSLSINRFA